MSKIKLEVEMDETWVPCFLSFLRTMQLNGIIGHSETLAIFDDGDGDFRPKFHNVFIDGKHIDFKNEIAANKYHTYRNDTWYYDDIDQYDIINLFDANIKNGGSNV